MVHHGTTLSVLPGIFHDGLVVSYGVGAAHTREVFDIPSAGVDCTGLLAAALSYPMTDAHIVHNLYSGELLAEDGTLPC